MNVVVISGNLTKDPELTFGSEGTPVCHLRLAVPGSNPNEADFVTVVAFHALAEAQANHLTTGRHVSVQGRLGHREWTDPETGQRREQLKVLASHIEWGPRPKQAATGDDSQDPGTHY